MSCQPLSKFLGLLLAICIYGDAYGLQTAISGGASTSVKHLGDNQTTAPLNTNQSAFTRAVAASEKRDQALAHWQAFQQSGVDTELIRSLENLAIATALAPESKATWQLAVRINYAMKHVPDFKVEAIRSLEKLILLDPEDLSARVLLVDELMSVRSWQRAAIHLEEMFAVNPYIATDTILDRMVACYLKAGWHERGRMFLNKQLEVVDTKEPLLIVRAIMERRAGKTDAALASLGKVLFSTAATKPMRAKARQLKTFWQENDWAPVEEVSP